MLYSTHTQAIAYSTHMQATVRRFFVVALLAFAVSPTLVLAQFGAGSPEFLDQDTSAVPDANEPDDLFGAALAAGDFDGDGYPDLVVQTRQEDINGVAQVGQVTVIRGSQAGLDPVLGAEVWNESLGLLTGDLEEDAFFGFSMATGDFNDDLIEDLAISVPNGDPVVNGLAVDNAGIVYVLWGSGVGLTHQGHLTIRRGTFGLPGEPVTGNRFGSTLNSGDFDGDGVDDLALGSSSCDFEPPGAPTVHQAGCVGVLYGSAAGLDASPGGGVSGTIFDLTSFSWVPAGDDRFGETLVAGDFDGDGTEDLAVAAPYRNVQGVDHAGVVFVLWGSEDGLTATDAQKIHRGTPGLWGLPKEDDLLGSSLATGDFDGDGAAELVIGVELADLLLGDEGLAYIVPGVVNGNLDTGGTVFLTQAIVTGSPTEHGTSFGSEVAVGDFDGDGHPDLAVSAPLTDPGGITNAGLAWILRGDSTGLVIELGGGQEISHADTLPGDGFGERLLAADFDTNGATDLVVGMPLFGADDTGGIDIFYGEPPVLGPPDIFHDGFETGDLSAWSSVMGE